MQISRPARCIFCRSTILLLAVAGLSADLSYFTRKATSTAASRDIDSDEFDAGCTRSWLPSTVVCAKSFLTRTCFSTWSFTSRSCCFDVCLMTLCGVQVSDPAVFVSILRENPPKVCCYVSLHQLTCVLEVVVRPGNPIGASVGCLP